MRNLRFYIYTALLVVVALLTIPYFCDLHHQVPVLEERP